MKVLKIMQAGFPPFFVADDPGKHAADAAEAMFFHGDKGDSLTMALDDITHDEWDALPEIQKPAPD